MLSWRRLALVLETTQKLLAKGEIQRECHRQKWEAKKNIKNTDWPRSKARKRDENMRIEKEGTTYEAGAFNF